jgi:hypothetical protein
MPKRRTNTTIRIHDTPLSERPFHGLGFQFDPYIYDEVNRKAGVTDEDVAMVERRIHAVRPAIARVFCVLKWWNPSLDGEHFEWESPEFRALVRCLKCLEGAGARVNLCHGRSFGMTWHPDEFPLLEKTLFPLLERLQRVEHIANLQWITLFNEPDSTFAHDSEVYRTVFGEKAADRPPWSAYVELHRRMFDALKRYDSSLRLIVADTVWGTAIRRERLAMAVRDFGDLDVAYSYHNYNPEEPDFYRGIADVWQYDGMAGDARTLRGIVGPERELVIWEFNNAGPGFGAYHPGAGPHGTELLGSIENAVIVCDKVFNALNNGVDGMCLWTVCDAVYCHDIYRGTMNFGLWRYKWAGWTPRPYYHYYAALCRTFRPPMRLLQTSGADEKANVLAAGHGASLAVAVINKSKAPLRVALETQGAAEGTIERIRPDLLPTPDGMPLASAQPIRWDGASPLELAPAELVVLRLERKS